MFFFLCGSEMFWVQSKYQCSGEISTMWKFSGDWKCFNSQGLCNSRAVLYTDCRTQSCLWVIYFKHKFKWKNSGENPGRTYKYNHLSDFWNNAFQCIRSNKKVVFSLKFSAWKQLVLKASPGSIQTTEGTTDSLITCKSFTQNFSPGHIETHSEFPFWLFLCLLRQAVLVSPIFGHT